MRPFSVSLLCAALLVLPSFATPAPPTRTRTRRQTVTPTECATPDTEFACTGNIPNLGNGTGIPEVANVQNAICKPYYAVRDAILGGIFQGRCNGAARGAVRLAFHDAGTFSTALALAKQPNGAADGSMLWDPNEVLRTENDGLQTIVGLLQPLPAKFNVTPGDVLHLAGVLGVLSCPGGPRVSAWVGRPLPLNVAPTGLLPSPDDPVPQLLDRFLDMGLQTEDLMALVGAHSSGTQQFVDPSLAGSSFDSTVDIWDVRFYKETNESTTAPGTLKLNSDVNFAHNASTMHNFQFYINNQLDWEEDYRFAHEKMSLLGLNLEDLTDCTEVLPASIDLPPLQNAAGDVDPTLLEAAIQKYRAPWLAQ